MTVHAPDLGRYFEDFVVGDVFRHPLGRTITATDNAWFTLMTMNTNQMHFNDDYAERSEFGRQLVNSGLTVALILGISVLDISQNAIANLGWDDIRLVAPVFVGDTLYGESVVLDATSSASRPHAGIVTVGTRGVNQRNEVVLTYRRTVMIYRRDADRARSTFPEVDEPIGAYFGLA